MIFVIFLAMLLSCSKQSEDTNKASKGPVGNLPENKIWNMDVMITNSGKLKAKFKGGVVERDNLGNSKYSESHIDSGMTLLFFEDEKQTGELISDRGAVNDLKGVFKALDNVVFKSTTGYVLYTDTLTWLRKEAIISTDSPVMMIKNEKDTLYGDGFITDDKFESYEVKNPRGKAMINEKDVD
ncbi:MAG: LPS export ABC transporter periplasmic protein LptC [Candidatus Delongbacteria bacterium]|jgi:LPS export ABC transporter protein LptC|nr:LPS export ABC transporter periplasmic protein LptC [Candidatus Delongbacteria bacterium]